MSNINSVNITGNLCVDPELSALPNGTSVARLFVAVNGRTQKNGEWVDKPNFFNVTVFGARAEFVAEYGSKGRSVAITGRLDYQEWQDKETGAKRTKVEIIANDVELTGNRNQNGDAPASSGSQAELPVEPVAITEAAGDDDIPF